MIFLSFGNENPNWHLRLKQWDLFSVAFQIQSTVLSSIRDSSHGDLVLTNNTLTNEHMYMHEFLTYQSQSECS